MGSEKLKKPALEDHEKPSTSLSKTVKDLRRFIFLAVTVTTNLTCTHVKHIPAANAASMDFSLQKKHGNSLRDETQPSQAEPSAVLDQIEQMRLLNVFHEKQGNCNLSESTIRQQISEHQARVKGSRVGTSETTNIRGMDNVDFLHDDSGAIIELTDILRRYLYNTVPRVWLNANNVKEIIINPHEVKLSHPGLEDRLASATYRTDEEGHGIVEIVSMELIKNPVEAFGRIVTGDGIHEIMHANGPETSPYISDEESLQKNLEMCERVISAGRPKFDYIEGINSSDDSKVEEVLIFRLREYMAVLMEKALSHCNILAGNWDNWELSFAEELIKLQASSEDAKANARIARETLENAAPDFFPFKTCKNAQKNAREFNNAIKFYYYKNVIAKLPDGKIKNQLLDCFRADAPPLNLKQSKKSKIDSRGFEAIKSLADNLAEVAIQITFEHTSPDTSSNHNGFLDNTKKLGNILLSLTPEENENIID